MRQRIEKGIGVAFLALWAVGWTLYSLDQLNELCHRLLAVLR